MSIIERHKKADESKLVDVEKGVVNKFRWEWMERVVEFDPLEKFPKLNWTHGSVRLTVKDHIRKIDQPGKVVCILCSSSDSFSYADGASAKHHKKHLKKVNRVVQAIIPTVKRELGSLVRNEIWLSIEIEIREQIHFHLKILLSFVS